MYFFVALVANMGEIRKKKRHKGNEGSERCIQKGEGEGRWESRKQEEIDRQTHLKRNSSEPGVPVNLETHLFGRRGASHFWQKGRELHG